MKTTTTKYVIHDGAGKFLTEYGPTLEENEWSENIAEAFTMDLQQAATRCETVKQFFPNCGVKNL